MGLLDSERCEPAGGVSTYGGSISEMTMFSGWWANKSCSRTCTHARTHIYITMWMEWEVMIRNPQEFPKQRRITKNGYTKIKINVKIKLYRDGFQGQTQEKSSLINDDKVVYVPLLIWIWRFMNSLFLSSLAEDLHHVSSQNKHWIISNF